MALQELVMPKMGESITEATILHWLKKPGDTIEQDESLLEVATDKVDTEVPSTHGGTVKELLAKEGDVVKVGTTIAIIATDGEQVTTLPDTELKTEPAPQVAAPEKELAEISSNGSYAAVSASFKSSRFYSPLVKNIAKQERIDVSELDAISGTGSEGRVTKRDIMAYLRDRKSGAAPRGTTQRPYTAPSSVPVSISAGDEIIEMDRMRKMIAERMVDSKRIAPHVTSFVEADVTTIVFWRNKWKGEFLKQEGDALTYTPIFIEAVVRAIKDYPMINVQVDGDRIIRKKDINIGMAVALPTGNLIVPVIKNADQYSLRGLVKAVNDLAKRARDNKLKADDLAGGTFSVSNVGSFGNVMGTPIIMQPQVAILALGAVVKKPSAIETPYGDTIGIRHKMFLSHSYDHRVVDGALGGSFVMRVADYLEKFDTSRSL
jgi:2-oxoglutarate dehydrogenase E2 component (dihydrolipoamide succinyltransferase)